MPGYWAAQLVGAVIAAGLLRSVLDTVGNLRSALPRDGGWRAVVMEALLTCLLFTVILGTAEGHRLVGHNAAIASGGYMMALAWLFASPSCGASMNPARCLFPGRGRGNDAQLLDVPGGFRDRRASRRSEYLLTTRRSGSATPPMPGRDGRATATLPPIPALRLTAGRSPIRTPPSSPLRCRRAARTTPKVRSPVP